MPKGRYTYTAYYNEDMEEIDERNGKFITIMNELGLSRNQTIAYLFDLGIDTQMASLAEQKQLSSLEIALLKHRDETREKTKLFAQMKRVYDDLGYDGFVEWYASIPGADLDLCNEFIEKETWRNPEMRKETRYIDFLRYYLSSGSPTQTNEIRQAAIDAGIITDSEDDWKTLRAIASRNGFTSPIFGQWSLPKMSA